MNTIQTSNKLQILEFFIFNRSGICLLHLDFQNNQNLIVNKALESDGDKANEHRYKLIFGLLFSMKSLVKNVSPNKSVDYFKSFSTSNYKLHYAEFLNGIRFVCITTLIKGDLNANLKEIFSAFYVNFVSKNILMNKEEPFKNELFIELTYNYLNNLNSI
jgi:hypothetical protein